MDTDIPSAVVSSVLQFFILAGVPLAAYFLYHRWRNGFGWREIARRAGLQPCSSGYLLLSALAALLSAGVVWVVLPSNEVIAREGSALRGFVGLEFGMPAIVLALLHAVVKTGLAEELLFRGLIAGSISRCINVAWANAIQALIFLVPHFLIVYVMPELWGVLPIVFLIGLVLGWIRIRSGSILGPWLIHASTNLTVALAIVARTAG